MKQVKLIIAGAGSRGQTYSQYALKYPEKAKVIGVADPRDSHRNKMAEDHQIPKENIFLDWKDMAAKERFADAVIISTQDNMHTQPAIAFAKQGYDILLEKPMAQTAEECQQITDAVNEKPDRIFMVCHVMRYAYYTRKMKELLDSGAIGDIVSIQHMEPIGYWHFAHSYVRGNWRNEAESSPMLLAKSCHDLDWLHYIMESDCKSISSYGNLHYFHKGNRPEGAADRCLDCKHEKTCPYSAVKIYWRQMLEIDFNKEWLGNIVTYDLTKEGLEKALREGPYGRCVYNCDNDVCDHQVVNMLFENGKTASFTVTAFTSLETGRRTTLFGTKGEMYGDGKKISVFDYMTEETTTYDATPPEDMAMGGHDGGDFALMEQFVSALQQDSKDHILTGAKESLYSHLMVFDAEKARKGNCTINR